MLFYPYYEHTAIGYNYRMSNVCAGIGRGQILRLRSVRVLVLDAHIAHHKHVQELYKELLADVPGVHLHEAPNDNDTANAYDNDNCRPDGGIVAEGESSSSSFKKYDSNFWLCAATIDKDVHVKGQENAYKEVIKTAVGGAAGVIKAVDSATTDCQPNENVEALRVFMLSKKVECRPVWKPMHKQPVYAGCDCYTNGIEEDLFKVGFCLPAGPYVTDDDVRYIVDCIKEAIS